MDIPVSPVRWRPCYRIVPSRFPPISVFDAVADPADLDAVFALEAMTNDRLRDEAGDLALVAPEDRVSGPGSTPIMAAFTHLNPHGDRFTDGTFGVFYAASTVETALAETTFHRARFMSWTREPAQELDMRVYAVDLDARLHDVRTMRDALPAIYDPDLYTASQALAVALRAEHSDGIVYHSVRHEDGECVAVFRPRLLSNCRQERHVCYVWDGEAIATVYEKRALDQP
ncbi:MAG TPA: RES family NAD+ phosphorylase [Novosphingobium sp.]|nr:RES family NAD+ phosphorylase [Novosphingobium sp.]